LRSLLPELGASRRSGTRAKRGEASINDAGSPKKKESWLKTGFLDNQSRKKKKDPSWKGNMGEKEVESLSVSAKHGPVRGEKKKKIIQKRNTEGKLKDKNRLCQEQTKRATEKWKNLGRVPRNSPMQ